MTTAGFNDIGLRAKIQGAGQFITDAEKINASMRTMTGQIANTAKQSTGFGTTVTAGFASVGRAVGGLVSAFAQLGFAVFAFQQIKSAVQSLVGSLTDAAAAWESYSVTFKVLTGRADIAQKKLEELEAFARKTPFTLVTVVEASKQMLAYGFSLDELIPKLTAVGDASAAMGAESFPRIIRALGQMRARMKVSAQEMLQLTEAGIPAWRMLAEAIGVSVGELQDRVTKGLIPAEPAIEVLTAGMEKQFGGLMEEQSKTFAGMTSNLEDWIFRAKRIVQEPIFEGLKKQLAGLLETLDTAEMEANLKQLGITIGNAFQAVIETVRGLGDAWADMGERGQKHILFLAALFVAKGPLVGGITFVIGAVKHLTLAFAAFATTVPGKISLVGLVLAGFAWAIEKFVQQTGRMIENLGSGFNALARALVGLPGIGPQLATGLSQAGMALRQTGQDLQKWTAITDFATEKAQDFVSTTAREFDKLVGKAEDWTIDKMLDQVEALRARVKAIPSTDDLVDTKQGTRTVKDTSDAVKVLQAAIHSGAADGKAAIKGLEGNVKELELALKEAGAAMRKFTDPRLVGMQAAEDEMFELDMAIKRARLSELQMGEAAKKTTSEMTDQWDLLGAQQREMAEGIPVPFQKAMDEIEKAQRAAEFKGIAPSADEEMKESERLARLREAKELIFALSYEPKLRDLRETMETMTGANQEITFEQAKRGLVDSIVAAAALSSELDLQQELLDSAKQAYEDQQTALIEQERLVSNIGSTRSGQVSVESTLLNQYQNQTKELLAQNDLWNAMGITAKELANIKPVLGPAIPSRPSLPEYPGETPGFQGGGTVARGGMAKVGEAGPEILYLPPGARVLPNSAFGGRGNTTNNDTFNLYQQTQPYDVMDRIRRYQKLAKMTQGR